MSSYVHISLHPPGALGSAKKKRREKISAASGPRGHEEFLERLLACALKTHRAKKALYQPVYSKARGFGLFALRDIEQGEVVQSEP